MRILASSSFAIALLGCAVYWYREELFHKIMWLESGKQEFNLPLATINITDAEINPAESAMKIAAAFRDVGFAYLVDIPGYDPDTLLEETKWVFQLDEQEKHRMKKKAFNPDNTNVYRGFYPVVPFGTSFKEAFEVGVFEGPKTNRRTLPNGRRYMQDVVEEPNIWPRSGNESRDAQFRDVILKNLSLYRYLSDLVLRLMAEGFGLNTNYFTNLFKPNELSTFRLLHYPSRLSDEASIPEAAKDGDLRIVTSAHRDTGIVTMLATFEYEGLQIQRHGSDKWIDIPAVKDHLVVNIGDLLMKMTDNRIVATSHRVLDTGKDRYSVPLFYEPDCHADLSLTVDGNKNVVVDEHTKYCMYMTNLTSQFYEYATTDFGVYVAE